jgi:Family of unknown function (DUF6492)
MPVSFGLITPSYAPDFQRCQLLVWSIDQYVQPPFTHYIVVDRCDEQLFSQLANAHTQILTVESIVPRWIRREPIWRQMWLSAKTWPIRNWILQQIVKLAVAQQITQDVAVFVDSDVAFVRSFNLAQLTRSEQVRLYCDAVGNPVQQNFHRRWHEAAATLLGLPQAPPTTPDYIGNLITWRRESVVQLCAHLEKIAQRSWVETLARQMHWSEYILYGLYVDQVAIESTPLHYPLAQNLCHDYWLPKPLGDRELADWLGQIGPDQVAIMISAKSGIPVNRYAPLIAPQSVSGDWRFGMA